MEKLYQSHEDKPTSPIKGDFTGEEAQRLGEALADIVTEIVDTFGYFQVPITHELFMEKFHEDIAALAEAGDPQPRRHIVLSAWEDVAQAAGIIMTLVTLDRATAKKAIAKSHSDRVIDDDYVNASLDSVAEKLGIATNLAREIATERGERGL